MSCTGNRLTSIALCICITTLFCITGCHPADENTTTESPFESDQSESLTSSEESVALPESSISVESSTSHKGSETASSEDEISEITPDESIPVGEIPQPDGPPDVSVSSPNQEFESGKITLTLDDGQEIIIADETAKTAILGYVDSMQESSYNAENTPPAMGGQSVTVTLHRHEGVEQYIFTEVTADGYSLGKNLQGDTFMWTITDSNALPYLLGLFQ